MSLGFFRNVGMIQEVELHVTTPGQEWDTYECFTFSVCIVCHGCFSCSFFSL